VHREKVADAQRKKLVLAEAVRRNPELANTSDPDNLRQLKANANGIAEEMKTAELLTQIEREETTAEQNRLRQEQPANSDSTTAAPMVAARHANIAPHSSEDQPKNLQVREILSIPEYGTVNAMEGATAWRPPRGSLCR